MIGRLDELSWTDMRRFISPRGTGPAFVSGSSVRSFGRDLCALSFVTTIRRDQVGLDLDGAFVGRSGRSGGGLLSGPSADKIRWTREKRAKLCVAALFTERAEITG
jgi:hypothetical protein